MAVIYCMGSYQSQGDRDLISGNDQQRSTIFTVTCTFCSSGVKLCDIWDDFFCGKISWVAKVAQAAKVTQVLRMR